MILLLYGTYLPVALVAFVIHTCDSVEYLVRDKKRIVSSTSYVSFTGVRLSFKDFS